MDLKEFSSPLPKPWLNINANSVHVGPGGGGTSNPVSSTAYSQIAPISIINSNAISSLSGNAAHTGSLTVGPLPVGAVVRMKAIANLTHTVSPGGGFNFFLRLNGATVITFANAVGGSIGPGAQVIFDANIVVLPGDLAQAALTATLPGTQIVGHNSGSFALSSATANTFDFAFQFNTADPGNQLNCTMYYAELLNAN